MAATIVKSGTSKKKLQESYNAGYTVGEASIINKEAPGGVTSVGGKGQQAVILASAPYTGTIGVGFGCDSEHNSPGDFGTWVNGVWAVRKSGWYHGGSYSFNVNKGDRVALGYGANSSSENHGVYFGWGYSRITGV